MNLIDEDDVIIDAGANFGWYTYHFANIVKNGGHIYAFEPLNQMYKYIEQVITLNGYKNITVAQLALADYEGNGTISFYNHMFSYASIDQGNVKKDYIQPVRITKIDNYFSRSFKYNRIQLIKMDIEGCEVKALRGAKDIIKFFRPVLIVECNKRCLNQQGNTIHDLLSEIRSHRYIPFNMTHRNKEVFVESDISGADLLCFQNENIRLEMAVVFLKIIFKTRLVYHWEVLLNILTSILLIAINIFLWVFLFRSDASMKEYMIKYTIISNIISMFYSSNVGGYISSKVEDGSIAIDLLRPINLYYLAWQIDFAGILSTFLIQGIPVILVYSWYLINGNRFNNVILSLLVIIMGHFLYFLIYAFTGILSFIFVNISYYRRLVDDTIRLLAGSFIPLSLLPGVLHSVTMFLPFRFLYSFPLTLLLDGSQVDPLNFLIMFFWLVVFVVINYFAYKLAIRKIVVQGG